MKDFEKEFAKVWATLDRAAEIQANTEKQIAEANAKFERTDRQIAESNAKFDKLSEVTEKKIAETTANIDKYLASIKETRKEIGGLSKSYGMHAENYFFESLKNSKQFGGVAYDYVDDDFKGSTVLPDGKRLDGQFDIVMVNGDNVAIVEVKSKVQRDDVKELVNSKVGCFKIIFPQYAKYKFYLGVAGFSFDKNAEQEAITCGVGILKPKGENVDIQDGHLIAY